MNPCIYLKGVSGVYLIHNTVNNKAYIGQTKCMYKRCHQYLYDFRERKLGHLNDYLFNAMQKIGIDKFQFIPLEFVDSHEILTEREKYWIEHHDTLNRNYGYNLRLDDQEYGLITNPETSEKMTRNLKSQWESGLRDGHSEKMKDSWASNPERRAKQSQMFREMRTKYEYQVHTDKGVVVVDYAELVDMGLQSAISNFYRKKSNDVVCKGVRVVRAPKGES